MEYTSPEGLAEQPVELTHELVAHICHSSQFRIEVLNRSSETGTLADDVVPSIGRPRLRIKKLKHKIAILFLKMVHFTDSNSGTKGGRTDDTGAYLFVSR